MAIKAILQTVDGKKQSEVVDPAYSLAKIWPVGDQSFLLLQYIDPYGNTIFNRQQMPEVEKEIDILLGGTLTAEQREIRARIRALATECHGRVHMFLRFRGD
jgi:hypothetical protein